MTFNVYNCRIKRERYGWLAQKRAGSQWKENSYFPTLEQAANYVFEQQLARVTKTDLIDLADIQKAQEQINRVITRMDCIRDEIVGVLHG